MLDTSRHLRLQSVDPLFTQPLLHHTLIYASLIIHQSTIHHHRPSNQNKVIQTRDQSSIHQLASQLATHPSSELVLSLVEATRRVRSCK